MPFSHMLSRGAVPNKCSDCQFLFEGECTRAMKSLGRFMALDHGTCRVSGSTDPVRFENQFLTSVVEIPRKCSNCALLQIDSIRGFTCGQDAHIWGNFPRELDWGSWHPEYFYVELPQPKMTRRALIEQLWARDLVGFLKEYRRINPDTAMSEARDDYARLLQLISGQD